MNRHIFLLVAFIMAFGSVIGQSQAPPPVNPDGHIPCYTVEMNEMMRARNPDMETVEEFEAWLDEKIRLEKLNGNSTRMVFTIPVIVHIIHEGEPVGSGFNISAAQVQSQIDVLNEDYRRMAGTPGFNNDPAGADIEIEFCLAFVDTAGRELQERGIMRHDRAALGLRSPFQTSTNDGFVGNYINSNVSPAVIWDPYQYMNIFVVPTIERAPGSSGAGTVSGFSRNPNTALPDLIGGQTFSDNNDGFVVRARRFGRVGSLDPGVAAGRTATHEIGHWLGLHHTWGPSNDMTDCTIDDFCGDTPQKNLYTFGCFNENQCGTPDMFRNYMDYTNGTCQNIFSNDQKTRMRTVMMNSPRRVELLSSTVCDVPTAAPVPAISYQVVDPCAGRVVFQDTSGTIPTNWFWSFGDGNTSTLRRPVHTYATPGTYTVNLVANNFLGTNSTNITINVAATGVPSINAGMDVQACFGDALQLNAVVQDPTLSFRWSPTIGLSNPNIADPTLTATSTRTYYVTATDVNGCSATDTIGVIVYINPVVNAGPDVTIAMGGFTQLNASASVGNVVGWDWTPNYGFTTPVNRPDPVSATDRTVTYTVLGVDANGCRDTDKVVVTVPGTIPVSIDKDFEAVGILNLPYPNPSSRAMTFSGSFQEAGELSVKLYDITGKQIQSVFQGDVAAGMFKHLWERPEDAANGVYLVVWEKDGVRLTQKIQLF